MIQIFLCQETKRVTKVHTFKYIYLYDIIESTVSIINPWSFDTKLTDNKIIEELHYKDAMRERIHKRLIDFEE